SSLTSRWTIPRRCAAERPKRACLAHLTASAGGVGPRGLGTPRGGGPGRGALRKKRRAPGGAPRHRTHTQWGETIAGRACASTRKRSAYRGSSEIDWRRSLTTTGLSRATWSAEKTSPIPPEPRRRRVL